MTRRILIADDEPHVVRVLARSLERAGYRVDSVANGADALARVLADPPDVLITDIQMPRMDGQGLCESLDAQLPGRTFPIYVHTSRTEIEHREWSSSIPNIRFLEKPVSVRRLIVMLDEHFAAAEHPPLPAGEAGEI